MNQGDLTRQPSADEPPACFICLEGDQDSARGRLGRHCRCPTLYSHRHCLLRWQLQNAGKKEEKVCRFCSSELQDWRQAVQETLPAASLGPQGKRAMMAVVFQGKTIKVPVSTGPEGVAEFKRTVCRLFNLPEETDFEVSFECRSPVFGDKLHLKGFSSFEAASYCAAVSAAKRAHTSSRSRGKQIRDSGSSAAAAAAGGGSRAGSGSGAGGSSASNTRPQLQPGQQQQEPQGTSHRPSLLHTSSSDLRHPAGQSYQRSSSFNTPDVHEESRGTRSTGTSPRRRHTDSLMSHPQLTTPTPSSAPSSSLSASPDPSVTSQASSVHDSAGSPHPHSRASLLAGAQVTPTHLVRSKSFLRGSASRVKSITSAITCCLTGNA